MNDPCSCDRTCPHGERCLGGHANRTDAHWYPCQTCTPASTVHRLADGRYLMVVVGCGHAVGPAASHRDLALAGVDHQAACRDATSLLLRWAADELDAQADAHREPVSYDLLDHLRCFATQPDRDGLIPWPEGVPRPGREAG